MLLQSHVSRESFAVGDSQRFCEPGGGVIGRSNVADLAFTNQAIKSAKRLFERGLLVVDMRVVEVDMIGSEAFQGFLRCGSNRLGRQAFQLRMHTNFRADSHPIALISLRE